MRRQTPTTFHPSNDSTQPGAYQQDADQNQLMQFPPPDEKALDEMLAMIPAAALYAQQRSLSYMKKCEMLLLSFLPMMSRMSPI